MMFTDTKPVVTQLLGMLRQSQCLTNRVVLTATYNGYGLIEHGQTHTHDLTVLA
jgi:hypothetical protein